MARAATAIRASRGGHRSNGQSQPLRCLPHRNGQAVRYVQRGQWVSNLSSAERHTGLVAFASHISRVDPFRVHVVRERVGMISNDAC